MLRIFIVESLFDCRLIVEGKLIAPWAAELRAECTKARQDLRGRELVIDVRNVSTISQEGENVLLELMNEGVNFRCRGAFTRQVLKQLHRRANHGLQGATG